MEVLFFVGFAVALVALFVVVSFVGMLPFGLAAVGFAWVMGRVNRPFVARRRASLASLTERLGLTRLNDDLNTPSLGGQREGCQVRIEVRSGEFGYDRYLIHIGAEEAKDPVSMTHISVKPLGEALPARLWIQHPNDWSPIVRTSNSQPPPPPKHLTGDAAFDAAYAIRDADTGELAWLTRARREVLVAATEDGFRVRIYRRSLEVRVTTSMDAVEDLVRDVDRLIALAHAVATA